MSRLSRYITIVALVCCGAFTSRSDASSVLVTSSGLNGTNPIAASALFSQTGTTLTITLTNTATSDTVDPTDVLTGLFFNLAGNPTLTKVSAAVASGSQIYSLNNNTGTAVVGTDISGEWAYVHNSSGLPGGGPVGAFDYGLGGAGYNTFGAADVFGTGPTFGFGGTRPDGVGMGLISAGDDLTTGNGGIENGRDFIKNGAVFTFTVPANFTLSSTTLGTVRFQYGTSTDETSTNGRQTVPAPASLWGGVALLGLLSMGKFLRRDRRLAA